MLATKYPTLDLSLGPMPQNRTNDWVDGHLVQALECQAVDGLVTADQRLTRKATRTVGSERVFSVADAIAYIESQLDVIGSTPPAVQACRAYELDMTDPFWESFRADYENFDEWMQKCCREHRQCWVVRADDSAHLAAVAIVKHETAEPRGSKTLKLCSFKVAETFSGRRLGELLLKAVFAFASSNRFDSLFVTAWPKHQQLISVMLDFGFAEDAEQRPTGERQLTKKLLWGIADARQQSALDYHVRYGPYCLDVLGARVYLVPIQPRYHAMLFPELQSQGSLFPGREGYANAIRKAYLCQTPTRSIEPGSALLFYRSGDERSISCVGIAERSMRSSDAAALARFVMPRTVYTEADIGSMAEGQREVVAVMFRQCLLPMRQPITIHDLRHAGILARAPQSIMRIKEEHKPWLIQRLSAPL